MGREVFGEQSVLSVAGLLELIEQDVAYSHSLCLPVFECCFLIPHGGLLGE